MTSTERARPKQGLHPKVTWSKDLLNNQGNSQISSQPPGNPDLRDNKPSTGQRTSTTGPPTNRDPPPQKQTRLTFTPRRPLYPAPGRAAHYSPVLVYQPFLLTTCSLVDDTLHDQETPGREQQLEVTDTSNTQSTRVDPVHSDPDSATTENSDATSESED